MIYQYNKSTLIEKLCGKAANLVEKYLETINKEIPDGGLLGLPHKKNQVEKKLLEDEFYVKMEPVLNLLSKINFYQVKPLWK